MTRFPSIAAPRNTPDVIHQSYGGAEDIARAARARRVERGKLAPGQITEETVSAPRPRASLI